MNTNAVTCILTRIHTCIYIHTFNTSNLLNLQLLKYTYIQYIHACIQTYIHTYIHTYYIHTYINTYIHI